MSSNHKIWLDGKGLQFYETLTQVEKRCYTTKGLFNTLISKFKTQCNETIKLQFSKLVRQMNENAEEWMGRLKLETVECSCTDID